MSNTAISKEVIFVYLLYLPWERLYQLVVTGIIRELEYIFENILVTKKTQVPTFQSSKSCINYCSFSFFISHESSIGLKNVLNKDDEILTLFTLKT